MKKVLFSAAFLLSGVCLMNAESYNRISLSYDWQRYGMNKEMAVFANHDSNAEKEGFNLNGFGINYAHGFGVAQNTFIETGISFTAGFGKKDNINYAEYEKYRFQENLKYANYNFKIPVNFVYRFPVCQDFSIAPYIGLNMKINMASLLKVRYETNIPEDFFEGKDDLLYKYLGSFSLFDKRECMEVMGNEDYTWNRFQVGWQIGANFTLKGFNLGVEYGTDFIPAFGRHIEKYGNAFKARMNSQALKVSFGYMF